MGVTTSARLDLKAAAKYVARATGAPTPHTATVLRWIKRGVRGHHLEADPVGMRWFTSEEAIDRFLREQAAAASTPAMPAGPMRAGQIAAAIDELDAELAGTTRCSRKDDRG